MLTRCVFGVVLFFAVCGTVCADTFLATITKVEGNKVTYRKATYHRDKPGATQYTHDELVTVEVSKDAAFAKGHFLPGDGATTTEGRVTGKTTPYKDGLAD